MILADGSVWVGEAFGMAGTTVGEVVFNTSMTGYQEVLTDPSYAGQIVIMTYPLIGNYGINDDEHQSSRPQVKGMIVREVCHYPSNWQSRSSLDGFLHEHQVVALAGLDTRALTRHLRRHGTMMGIMDSDDTSAVELAAQLRAHRPVPPVSAVTTKKPYRIYGNGPHVVVVDFGVKRGILHSLANLDCQVTVVPADTTAGEILAARPDGVLLSNGPGDPKCVPAGIAAVKELVGKVPIFGICLGHQILGLACGMDTCKMKYGHRGSNHPVKDFATGRVWITSQNHGYVIDKDTLPPAGFRATHINLHDGTVEGMRHKELPIISVQYHPEAAPGPHDTAHHFIDFLAMMASH